MFDTKPTPNPIEDRVASSSQAPLARAPSDRDLQRAEGSGRIIVASSKSGTRIEDVFQRAPVRIMFPRRDDRVEEAVLVNTAGGVAGGDRLEIEVIALADASIVVTTQAAEKVYRALNEPACIKTRLTVRESAKIAWLPQETIVFDRARLCRRMEVDLSSGAELLALEWLVLGRAAYGEEITAGHIGDSWRVKKDGRLIWADNFRATGEALPQFYRKALLADCKAIGTLIYFGPNLDTRLDFLRGLASSLACHCAATLVGGLIVVRFAARLSSELRRALHGFLSEFGLLLGPGPFQVPRMWSC